MTRDGWLQLPDIPVAWRTLRRKDRPTMSPQSLLDNVSDCPHCQHGVMADHVAVYADAQVSTHNCPACGRRWSVVDPVEPYEEQQ